MGEHTALADVEHKLRQYLAPCSVLWYDSWQVRLAGQSGRGELLAMLGIFGTLISAVQLAIVERHAFAHAAWSWQVSLLAVHCSCPIRVAKNLSAAWEQRSAMIVRLQFDLAKCF